MLRAMRSAASGMKAQQLYLDTIANNLANVNTTAFKRSRLGFEDLLYQTLSPATGGEGDPPIHEPGSRETVVVLSGAVELTVEGERYPLGAGDSATFDADLPHHLHNPGPEPARLLAVVAAGLRRS